MEAALRAQRPQGSGHLRPLSVDAYHSLGEAGLIPKNTELLYGFVYTKMWKSPLHSALVRRLFRLLAAKLPRGFFVDSEQPITCVDSEPEPDIAVIKGREEDFWEQHPRCAEVIVEICITSHEYDQSKLAAYASAGVTECWFVLGLEKEVEVCRRRENGVYTQREIYSSGDVIECSSVPNCSIEVEDIFLNPMR